MKGFPNQFSDLTKIAASMRVLRSLVAAGGNPRDDGVFGVALVRAGVAGTGHIPKPVEKYLSEQRQKPLGDQSFRTTARGLRELFVLLGFIEIINDEVAITINGDRAAQYGGAELDSDQIEFWRKAVRDMVHQGGGESSHPYQVLLRLVGRAPGIPRAKCALALEARNDSKEELDRIVALAALTEDEIREEVGVSASNWNNAKKVLPKFAEQLGDVIKTSQGYQLADAPGLASQTTEPANGEGGTTSSRAGAPKPSRAVTPETIARTKSDEEFDEADEPSAGDPAAQQRAVLLRRDRLRRHNLIVRSLAERFAGCGYRLYEDPFDILAMSEGVVFLVEVKSLEDSQEDERARVREALAQLLYYEAFVAGPLADGAVLIKVACFERRISTDHQAWLNSSGIAVLWRSGSDCFEGDTLARHALASCLEELGSGG